MPEKNKWDLMLSLFIDKKIFKRELLIYESEIITIQQLYKFPVVRQLFSRWIESLTIHNTRNEQLSKSFRERGNDLYKSKPPKYKDAIEFYTKAIYHAPNNSLELALAHANRASALMGVKYFQEAYDDCEMAVKFSYPKENILKILFRLAACSAELKDKHLLQKDIKSIENELKDHKSNNAYLKKLIEYRTKLQELKKSANEDSPQNSTKSKILIENISRDQGRFIIAGERIKRDEIILTEKAFAFVPVYENYPDDVIDTDCQNCAKVNIISFPCYDCYKASYCSTKCRKDHEFIHKIECHGYKKNLWYYIGIAHLSVRTFLCGFNELIERLENENFCSLKEIWTKTLSLSEDKTFKYGRILRLISNFNNLSNTHDFLRYSLTATMLTVYLKERTNFFDSLPPICCKIMDDKYNWELFVGSLIMLHMGQLVSNGHAITDLRTTLTTEIDCLDSPIIVKIGKLHCYIRSVRVFTAIFPNISMLNHSCNPSIRNSFDRNQLTISAVHDIAKDSEVFNCYGPNYKIMNTADRKQSLKEQYCFDCSCEKCTEIPEDRTYHQYYLCEKCSNKVYIDESKNFWWRNLELQPKIECENCKQNINFAWFKSFMSYLGEIETEGKIVSSFSKVCDIYESIDRTIGIYNELRQDIGIMILCHFIPYLSTYLDFNERLSKIATGLLKSREHKFGMYSIEFIIACTYLLDLMALQKRLQLKLSSDFNINHIKKSFQILSENTQEILNNYINYYILCK